LCLSALQLPQKHFHTHKWRRFREYSSFRCSLTYLISSKSLEVQSSRFLAGLTNFECVAHHKTKYLFLKHYHYLVSVLLGCGATSMGNSSLHQESVVIPPTWIRMPKKKFAHFHPWRWGHFITSKFQKPISQWYGAMAQMDRDLKCTSTTAYIVASVYEKLPTACRLIPQAHWVHNIFIYVSGWLSTQLWNGRSTATVSKKKPPHTDCHTGFVLSYICGHNKYLCLCRKMKRSKWCLFIYHQQYTHRINVDTYYFII
jgi:hypothetical protein